MRWELIHTLNDSNHWKLNSHHIQAGLRYNKLAHSIRINTNDKRLFFLEKSGGVIQSKIILRTEYSVVIGESFFDKNRTSGLVEINGIKYTFRSDKNDLKLFDRKRQLVSSTEINQLQSLEVFEFSALLFATGLVVGKKAMEPEVFVQ